MEIQSAELPVDLLIIGSKTTSFFDHCKGRIICNSMLFLNFKNDSLCFWGLESDRWIIIQESSIPNDYLAPFHFVDPLKWQTGSGKMTKNEDEERVFD
ncbi:unnamed protein product [Brugia pahangi]|uniref:Uncharacterized protein n=1 Tax=Brugia pahangi TaxID=6280 RepID=A0A0N4TN82_BRUPA|nr:unnamed protein product [Brugia pahangi]